MWSTAFDGGDGYLVVFADTPKGRYIVRWRDDSCEALLGGHVEWVTFEGKEVAKTACETHLKEGQT